MLPLGFGPQAEPQGIIRQREQYRRFRHVSKLRPSNGTAKFLKIRLNSDNFFYRSAVINDLGDIVRLDWRLRRIALRLESERSVAVAAAMASRN
jgi:hypothetical protein